MADNKTMSTGEKANLLRAVQIARDPNSTRDQVKEAGRIQRELKKKYPDTYGAIRGEMFETVTSGEYNRGGDAKKKTKKVPAIAVSIGMVDAPKNGKGKAAMAKGGMANGKQHMYAAGGSVTDNPGLKALRASGPKGMQAYKKITGQ